MKEYPPHVPHVLPLVYVRFEPDGARKAIPRPKTALQLLERLNLHEEEALVIRNGQLLTPDRHIWPGDSVIVRVVASRG